jgi:hypothetical protein
VACVVVPTSTHPNRCARTYPSIPTWIRNYDRDNTVLSNQVGCRPEKVHFDALSVEFLLHLYRLLKPLIDLLDGEPERFIVLPARVFSIINLPTRLSFY